MIIVGDFNAPPHQSTGHPDKNKNIELFIISQMRLIDADAKYLISNTEESIFFSAAHRTFPKNRSYNETQIE